MEHHVTTTFTDLGVPNDLAARLDAEGMTSPFPVQHLTLPDALAGRDLCGRAPTGSGKTLAFAIPVAARVAAATPGCPRALILVPTRELAAQVRETLTPLAETRRRRVATVYGGTNIRRDQQRLRRGIDILVATPGRLADLVQRGDCDLGDVDLVVLDEADRMADMGFLPEVKRLLDRTSTDRQTLLFSATLDGDVDELVRRYQHQPARHEVADDPDAHLDVRHVFWPAERDQRRRLTAEIVRRVDSSIVFTRTKHGADRLARQLATDGISTAAIHGNRNQNQRERALARFTAGEVTTLVATDVAARGIHVDDVGAVVHYDLPGSDKDYVHRSGRTGRAGALGLVVSLVAAEQATETASIQRSLDLPAGLHEVDLDLLTAEELPAPVTALDVRGGSGQGRARRAGSGQGQARRSGSGQGQARRSGAGRGGSPRGGARGGARSRDRRAGRN
jgi:superfamily II DNA/RNA helicase